MADIEVVIKIPEKKYQWIKENRGRTDYQTTEMLYNRIRKGTPLPKGHGRMGDLDALQKEVSSWGMNDYEPSDFIDAIDWADTIIEADRAESEDTDASSH